MAINVKFYDDHSPNIVCHVTLDENFENVYCLPNFVFNLRKGTRFGGNWFKNKKLQAKSKTLGEKHPLPQFI